MPRSQSWLHTVFLSLVVVIHLPTGLAQDDPASSTESPTTSSIAPDQPSPTNSAPAQTYTIQVGLADHKFKPEVTTANIGDTIEFAFYPRNHSVVRAEYGFPCIPYEMTGASKTGFFAGFHTVDTVLSSPPTYRILINDTDPIFFYCSAPGSCLTYGMVGAINPNASMSVQKQQQLALSSTYMLNPGEPFPDESPSASNPATSSATANTDTGKPADEKGLSTGAIVGIVVGGSSIIFVAALFFFFWGRTTSLANEVSRKPGSRRWGIHGSGKSSAAMLEQSHRANMTATENPLHQQYYYHNPHHHHHPHHNHHSPHEAPPAGTHATDTRNGSYHQHYPPAPHHATYSSVLGYNHTSSPVTRPLYLAAPYPPPPLSTTATTPKHTTIPHQAFFQHHQQLPSSSSPHELSPTGDSPTHKGFAESSSGGLDAASASGLASTTMAIPATNTNATANTAAAPNTNTATALPPAPPTPHNTQDMTTTTTTTTTSEQAKPENHKTTPPQHNNNTTTAKTNTTTTAIPTTNTASTTNAKTTSIVAASVDEPDTSELVPSYFDSVYQGRGRAS